MLTNCFFNSLRTLAILAALLPGFAAAEHVDILFSLDGNKLVTGGFDDGAIFPDPEIVTEGPQQVYEYDVEFRGNGNPYDSNDPGLQAVTDVVLFDPLPVDADLSFDALTMDIGGNTSTLYYWDGTGGSVDFQPASSSTNFELSGDGGSLDLTGTQNTVQTGFTVATVGGGVEQVHLHLNSELSTSGGQPDEGYYLLSLEFALDDGSMPTDPLYLVYATIPDLLALGDGGLAALIEIEEGHEMAAEWTEAFFSSQANIIPEPSTCGLALLGVVVGGCYFHRRRILKSGRTLGFAAAIVFSIAGLASIGGMQSVEAGWGCSGCPSCQDANNYCSAPNSCSSALAKCSEIRSQGEVRVVDLASETPAPRRSR